MPKVYVPNKGAHDYSAALRFGHLVFVTEGVLDRWGTSQMFRLWSDALTDSTPEDYILETSLNTLCSVGAACFAHRHGRLNLLLFKDGGYVVRTVVINQEGEQNESKV